MSFVCLLMVCTRACLQCVRMSLRCVCTCGTCIHACLRCVHTCLWCVRTCLRCVLVVTAYFGACVRACGTCVLAILLVCFTFLVASSFIDYYLIILQIAKKNEGSPIQWARYVHYSLLESRVSVNASFFWAPTSEVARTHLRCYAMTSLEWCFQILYYINI